MSDLCSVRIIEQDVELILHSHEFGIGTTRQQVESLARIHNGEPLMYGSAHIPGTVLILYTFPDVQAARDFHDEVVATIPLSDDIPGGNYSFASEAAL